MDDDNTSKSDTEIDFASVLKTSRTSQKLSIKDVAKKLHLDEKTIYALENRFFDELPQPAYVCGYIRNYARLLNLESDALVTSYTKEFNLKAQLNKINIIKGLTDTTHQKSPWAIWFVLFILCLGGAFVWFGYNKQIPVLNDLIDISTGSNSSIISTEQEVEDNMDMTNTENEIISITGDATPSGNSTEQSSITLRESLSGPEKKTLIESAVINNTPAKAIENVAEEDVIPVSQTDNIQQQDMPVEEKLLANEENRSENTEATINADNLRKITLSFDQDSWVSIKDANDKSLVYNLIREGKTLNIQGEAPISIFLGNATGVNVSVEGESYNFSQYINKNLARFIIN